MKVVPHLPLHPFLFAAASVLALLAGSVNYAFVSDAYGLLAGTLGFALVIYLLAVLLRRRFDPVAAVIASIWVVGSLFYLQVFGGINRSVDGGFAMVRSLPIALAAMLLATLLAVRFARLAPFANTVLNVVALVMVATPAWQIASYQWHNAASYRLYNAEKAAAAMPQIASGREAPVKRRPDIYHFIFDRYPSEGVLSTHYGKDNRAIGQYLEARGFRLARESNSNYLKTGPSLASTFYMDYLDLFEASPPLDPNDWHPIFAMLKDHRVARFLKARGYEIVQFGSWWAGTYENTLADKNRPYGFSEFEMQYLRKTVLRPLFHALPDTPLTMRLDWDNGQCQRVPRQVEALKRMATENRDRPRYVFAHFLLPHGPYNFTADGGCLTGRESAERGEARGYLDQISYANIIIRDLARTLQESSGQPPVILIQSDEGPFPPRDGSIPWQDAEAQELEIKSGILNAYFFPNGDYGAIAKDITPVNSYRVLFNSYFDAGLPLLEDRIMAFPHDWEIYEYHDVTEKVRGARNARPISPTNRSEPAEADAVQPLASQSDGSKKVRSESLPRSEKSP